MKTEQKIVEVVDGETVTQYTLTNDVKTEITILSYGGIWQSFNVYEKGQKVPLIWGLDSIADYQRVGYCVGQSIGRVAGRLSGAKFKIDQKTYHVDMNRTGFSIHGGAHGFNTLNFDGALEQENETVSVTLSKHILSTTDQYPGNLDVAIKFSLDNRNRVTIQFTGKTDAPTLFNPTSHVYWNTTTDRCTLAQQSLQVNSQQRLVCDEQKVPTGEMIAVKGTAFDFNRPRLLKVAVDDVVNMTAKKEIDETFVVRPDERQPIAILGDANGNHQVKVFSNRNGLVIFTANPFDSAAEQRGDYNAVAVEAQTLPDAINHTGFGNIVLRPGQPRTDRIAFQYQPFN